jgi:hypothetical protein
MVLPPLNVVVAVATPLIGRVFTEEDDIEGARVAVISYGLWQRRYGGSPGISGRKITMNYSVRSSWRNAARVLSHAGARYRHLDAGLFKPQEQYHKLVHMVADEVIAWGGAFKRLRESH